MATYKPFKGEYRLSAGYRYSNGDLHAAYDVAMPTGTPLYSPRDGVVLDCNDGESNNPPRRYRGMPSNWVLLGFEINGQKYGFYSQHMSPGIKVHKGQRVHAGQLIGYSGNSGNSTGPHWHNSAQKSWSLDRYLYLRQDCVYPPSKLWGEQQPGGKVRVPQRFPGRKAVTQAMRTGRAPWVRKIKKALAKQGYEVGHKDDVYSTTFKQAVRKYKLKHKLGVTARVGKRMWNKLDIKRTL